MKISICLCCLILLPVLVKGQLMCQVGTQVPVGFPVGDDTQLRETACLDEDARCGRVDIRVNFASILLLVSNGVCVSSNQCSNLCTNALTGVAKEIEELAKQGAVATIDGCDFACCATDNCNRVPVVQINGSANMNAKSPTAIVGLSVPTIQQGELICKAGAQSPEQFPGGGNIRFIEIPCQGNNVRCARADINILYMQSTYLFGAGLCVPVDQCSSVCDLATNAIEQEFSAIPQEEQTPTVVNCTSACCASNKCNEASASQINESHDATENSESETTSANQAKTKFPQKNGITDETATGPDGSGACIRCSIFIVAITAAVASMAVGYEATIV